MHIFITTWYCFKFTFRRWSQIFRDNEGRGKFKHCWRLGLKEELKSSEWRQRPGTQCTNLLKFYETLIICDSTAHGARAIVILSISNSLTKSYYRRLVHRRVTGWHRGYFWFIVYLSGCAEWEICRQVREVSSAFTCYYPVTTSNKLYST